MKKGWRLLDLSKISEFEGGSQPPKAEFIYEQKEGYVRFLQIRDFKSEKNVTFIKHSKKNRYCLASDILIGRYGASVGQILTGKSGAYNVALMKAIPDETIILKRFFFHYLNSPEFQTRLMAIADRSAQNGFSKDDIAAFPVIIPPMLEQMRIVENLDAIFESISNAIENAERKLMALNELKEVVLQRAFSGELTGKLVKSSKEAAE
jgi:type I restriction enzyme S subunit